MKNKNFAFLDNAFPGEQNPASVSKSFLIVSATKYL